MGNQHLIMTIQTKISQYLEKELELTSDQRERENRQKVLNYLEESKGECSGLATMWAYSKMTAKDGETFFNKTNKLLLAWDGQQTLSAEDKKDVDQFIANAIFYQGGLPEIHNRSFSKNSIGLLQLEPDSEGREFQHSYNTESAFLSKDLLQDRLAKIIKPATMTFLSFTTEDDGFGGHRVAIFQDPQDNKFYYYNSADGEELGCNTIDDLAEQVWRDTKRSNFKDSSGWQSLNISDFKIDSMLREVSMDVVQFVGDAKYEYPKPSEFPPSATENKIFLESKGSQILELSNNEVIKRYFLSLDKDSQVELMQNQSENREIFAEILIKNLLHPDKHVIDPSIAKYLLNEQSDVLQSLVDKGSIKMKDLDLLKDEKKLFYALSQTLETACHNGDCDKVKALVKMGLEVKGNNLSSLIEHDRPEILSFLAEEKKLDLYNFKTVHYQQPRPNLDNSPDTIDRFNCEDSPIVWAARYGATKNLEYLVAQLDKNESEKNNIAVDIAGFTILGQALYYACHNNHPDAVKFLLKSGANPDVRCSTGAQLTALEIAAWNGSREIVQELIKYEVDVKQGEPLIRVTNPQAAEMLLEAGASTEVREYGTWTPLLKACKSSDVEMARVLLKYKADPNSCDRNNQSPIMHVMFEARNEDSVKIMGLLLESGANPNLDNTALRCLRNIPNNEVKNKLEELLGIKQNSPSPSPEPVSAATVSTHENQL